MILKKSYIVMSFTFLLAVVVITKSFVFNEGIKLFLPVFFMIGCGLGLLRIFVNNSIKKMVGKSLKTKVLFFVVLLGIGLPLQTLFRTKVLYTMNPEYLPRNIFMLITGMIFMTTFSRFIKDKMDKPSLEVE